jgi:hypothetical protein
MNYEEQNFPSVLRRDWLFRRLGLAAFVAGLRALTIPPLRESDNG